MGWHTTTNQSRLYNKLTGCVKEVQNMAKLSIIDVVTLAKQGFTAHDIKDLMNLDVSENSGETVTENKRAEESPNESDGKKATVDEHTQDDNIDYKSLFEKQKEEIENLKTQVTNLQDANIRKNVGSNNTESNETTIENAFRNFM